MLYTSRSAKETGVNHGQSVSRPPTCVHEKSLEFFPAELAVVVALDGVEHGAEAIPRDVQTDLCRHLVEGEVRRERWGGRGDG